MSRDIYEHKHTFEVIPPLPQEPVIVVDAGLHEYLTSLNVAIDSNINKLIAKKNALYIKNGTTNNNK